MSTSNPPTDPLTLTSVALELFKGRSLVHGTSPQQLAISCFRDAQAFLEAASQVVDGNLDLQTDETNPLDAAFAPNLKRTHPINLMSRAWGDVRKVQDALADLEANPGAETYERYSWGRPEVNQARALFPAVVQRAKQVSVTK